MGREIACLEQLVYKYSPATQNSDMRRIATQFNIGFWTLVDEDYDQLRLDRKDILSLRSLLRIAKFTTSLMSFISFLPISKRLSEEDKLFTSTLEAILAFMEARPDVQTFVFEGEL